MWSRIRTVMMWCLIAALPVQSWAVATMVNCGPSHHRMSAATASGEDHHAHGHDHASHQHETSLQVSYPSHEATDDTQPPLSLAKFKCSACATCCLATALPSSVLTFEASVSPDTVEPGLPHARVVFLTTGVERPPRSILA